MDLQKAYCVPITVVKFTLFLDCTFLIDSTIITNCILPYGTMNLYKFIKHLFHLSLLKEAKSIYQKNLDNLGIFLMCFYSLRSDFFMQKSWLYHFIKKEDLYD